jgi:hypothetical protein
MASEVTHDLAVRGIMPTPDEILSGLREIANTWRVLAIFWHVYFGVLAVLLLQGVRPPRNVAGVLLGLPLLSVSALAWIHGNPFNGAFFTLSGIALIALSKRLSHDRVRVAPWWAATGGALLFAFGWVYPHFLNTSSFLPYLYSAPTGLIPCPTLSIAIGLAFILGGLGSRAYSLVIGVTGIFYGLFGSVRLGVLIDWVLLVAALVLVFPFLMDGRRGARIQF